jgi:hypothetical protein
MGHAAAFAKTAYIECKRVDAGRRQEPGRIVPGLTLPVVLMEQQHTGARLCRRKVTERITKMHGFFIS